MTIKRINPIKTNLGYCLDDPLKIDINQFFQELENLGYTKRQQALGIDTAGKPARLETMTKNTTKVEYNIDKCMIVLRDSKISEEYIKDFENVLFNIIKIEEDDLIFFELYKIEIILTDKMAIEEIGKYNNKNVIDELNSIFSREFQSGNIRIMSTNKKFERKKALNEIEDYFEINISPYVPRPEYYQFQIVLRGKYDYVKENLKLIDDNVKKTISFIEGED